MKEGPHKHSYFEKYSHEPLGELDIEDKELSNMVRTDFFRAVEKTMVARYDHDSPPIPAEQRELKNVPDSEGRVVAKREKIRSESEKKRWGEAQVPHDEYWFIVDFDDVLNKTTSFSKHVASFVEKELGIRQSEFKQLYDASKVENEQDKKVLRMDVLLDSLEQRVPGAKKLLQKFFGTVDYSQFIDAAVMRSILSMVSLQNPNVEFKFKILTFGDVEYQRGRITQSGVEAAFDEVIYTEGSKREVIQALLSEENREGKDHPFVITIDDSPEHVEDLENLPFVDHYANIRFRHPQAKRYTKEDSAKTSIEANERESNQAAIDLYRMISYILQNHNLRSSSGEMYSREKIFEDLKDPQKLKDALMRSGKREETVKKYSRSGNMITREVNFYPNNTYSNTDRPKYDVDRYSILPDGSLVDEGPLSKYPITPKFDFEEFIRGE